MRVHLICLILTFVSLIDHNSSFRPNRDRYRSYESDYPEYGHRYYPRRAVSYSGRPNARAISDIPGVGMVATFTVRVVKQLMQMIRCITSCFFNYLTSNLCTQMFPCLYDCFIGQPTVSSEVENKLKEAKITYPEGISLNSIYEALKCLKDCAVERPITNWESFSYALYCVADSCICYRIFGQIR